ncbi:MAG TPA: hypothetical protein DEA43_03600 [Candidatus Moranbacteria bacterium]|nr:hypothetical protein [Candidatus Moranbacteria bacterium]HBT45941.1 hypothetical protein [Candidatus Moranbacteria bacterium]
MNFLKPKFYLLTLFTCIGFFVATAEAQAATPVYYSVGQSTADLKTGTPTVTISSGVATFSAAQTGNIGVGDRVTYNTTDIAYIAAKTSTSVWTLVTKTGAVPADITTSTVVSIKREYTSLSAAVTGAIDANHLNTTDLVAGNYQLNFPCYYDSAADTTAVNVTGYTTGASNFIKIYTPNNTTNEANNSQRHQGKWDDGKYQLSVVANEIITVSNNYTQIIGLQIKNRNSGGVGHGLSGNGTNLIISSNISIYAGSGSSDKWQFVSSGGSGKYANNIAYSDGSGVGFFINSSGSQYLYNNTVINDGTGFYCYACWPGPIVAKNNITQVADGFYGTFDSSSNYNISSAAADAPGANSKNSTTVQFADAPNKDFHLSPSDAAAKNAGADLSADANLPITTDIDGQTRPTGANIVDIGADEAATAIYYSVGQNTNSHETGAGTVTVDATARTATFSVAQTATNMGVGDLITYTGGSCYISSKTSTTIWGCQSATGGAPIAATDADVTSIAHAYASLSAAEAGAVDATHLNTTNLVTGNYQLNFPCYYDSGADTTAVNVSGYTTGASNFIKIYTPNNTTTEVNASQRHQGKWDNEKYRLEISAIADYAVIVSIGVNHLKLEGIQIKFTNNDYGYGYNVNVAPSANSEVYLNQNIIRSVFTTTNADSNLGIKVNHNNANAKAYITNNIIYDIGRGGHWSSAAITINGVAIAYAYNNTIYNSQQGINSGITSSIIKNNLSYDNGNDYYGSFNAASANNISKDASSPNVSFRSKTVFFVDTANKDFHLSPTDIAAKNFGVDLSSDSSYSFTTDIDGNARPAVGTVWDIGADEAANAVYYSVGQNTTDHKTGAPTVTIASGVATFSVAQTATNLGVGDKVTYNTTDVAYIASKTSTSVWNLVTATGGIPADITTSAVVSIAHSYASLSAAEAGAVDATHLNTSDLVAGNYQLNFPCYYDTGADTTAVTIDGYTTGISNYIKIYTPNNISTEVNQSQRHNGKWDDGKYSLSKTNSGIIAITENYVWLDGLQVFLTAGTGNWHAITATGQSSTAVLSVSNSILKFNNTAAGGSYAIVAHDNNFLTLKVWNNLLYGWLGTNTKGIVVSYAKTGYLYNNTVYDSNIAFACSYNVYEAIAKNNIVNNISVGFSGTFSPSSGNNISSDATAPGANSKNFTTVSFVDALNKDFHLSISDTSAKNSGGDLSADTSFAFATDIDGQTRPSSSNTLWDIGADEASSQIFYSVGQSTADLKTGTPTVTISSGVATFSAAQTGNIGVGDRVTYNTTDIAYIAAKTSTSVWTLVTKTGAVPADITTSTVVSIKHEYTSLSAAVTGAIDANHLNTTDLVTGNYQLNFPCYYDSAADTTAVTVSGYTTGVLNYIKIYTPNNTTTEANNSQRHQGKWDDGKYNLYNNVTYADTLDSRTGHIFFEGLQLYGGVSNKNVISFLSDVGNSSSSIVRDSIIKSNNNVGISGICTLLWMNDYYVYNNIFIDIRRAINRQDGDMYAYNNTIINSSEYGIFSGGNRTAIIKNSIVQNCTDGFYGTFNAASNYNISDLAADAPGANSKNSTTVQFADAANKDFHLSISDISARNSGSDLSADANLPVTTDIDGQTRPTGANIVDIGADEAATQIYYSVGQNTNSHETGAGTVTVDATARTATFSVAQTATNMGVGDKVSYTGGSCYISSKISTTIWGCQSAIGGAPIAATDADVTSIAHAYASLSAAEAGAVDATHLNTTDLVAGNYQLNFPCYYDTGADNSFWVELNGLNTGLNNYVKIYTPTNTSTEVNFSQRHSGKSGNGFQLAASSGYNFVIYAGYYQIDGLVVLNGRAFYESSGAGKIKISNCVINSSTSEAAVYQAGGSHMYEIFNNIIYNTSGGGILAFSPSIIYNNTIVYTGITPNIYAGIYGNSSVIVKNNTVQNFGGSSGFYDFTGTFNAASANNISKDASSPNVSFRSKTVFFVDTANKDFHLASTDTAAKGVGLDLQWDSYFAFDTDIDGQVRVNPWDIGADQFSDTVVQTDQPSPNLDAGLVGHWTFDGDDTSGNITKDVSGNANNGTINSAIVTPAKLGQGMNFNNTSNYVEVANASSLQFSNGAPITISVWVNPSQITSVGTFLVKGRDSNDLECNYAIRQDASGKKLEFYYNDGGSSAWQIWKSSTDNFTQVGAWYHVAITYTFGSADTMSAYINGQSVAGAWYQGTGNVTPDVSLQVISIGKKKSATVSYEPFVGKLDDIRVYNRVLSLTEITQLYKQEQATMQSSQNDKVTNGLVGLWSFDGPDISGNTAYDRSGAGRNGTISGATVIPAKVGQGLNFNGTNSNVSVSYAGLDFERTDPFSLSIWAKRNSTGPQPIWQSLIGKGSATSGIWFSETTTTGGAVPANANAVMVALVGTNFNQNTVKTPINSVMPNSWYHIVFTYDGSSTIVGMKIYINGVSQTLTTVYSVLNASIKNTNNWMIGDDNTGDPFNGILDEARIYNRTLSASEVSNLYNTGKVEMRR